MSSAREERPGLDLTRFNPPGLGALSYRAATYQASLARMLSRLPTEAVQPGDARIDLPLAALNVEADDDWTVALLHAWAVVADVLSFYQERIINEGYLRTATERRSLLELARSIGYELRPGVAAGTYLAFTVQVGHDEPPCQVDLPASTAVQGMSSAGQLPQVFETSEAFAARSEWNLLRPVSRGVTSWEHDIYPETTSLRLLGDRTDLQPGDPILILGDDEERWRLVWLVAVDPDLERGFTVVRWANGPDEAGEGVPLRRPRLFAMRRQASLFGYAPTGVYLWAEHDDRWRPAGIGLPSTAVQMLLATQPGHLFAATEKDIFRSVDQGVIWTQASTGLIEKSITALAVGDGGEIWAGSDEGEIFLSRDDGDNWRAPGGDRMALPVRGLKKLWPGIVSSPLPKTVIRSLAAYSDGDRITVAAGTDDGVFLSTNEGKSWKPANVSLPKVDRKTGLTKELARTVIAAKMGTTKALFAGTDAGVFRISRPLNIWTMIGLGSLLILLQRLYVELPESQSASQTTGQAAKESEQVASLVNLLLQTTQRLPDQLPTQIQKVLKPLVDALPPTVPRIEDLFGFLQGPIPTRALDVLNSLLLFALDVALIVAFLVVIYLAWWWLRRHITSRPFRCIGVPVYALAASPTGQLFAGTDQGLFRSNDPAAWRHQRGLRRLAGHFGARFFPGWNRRWALVKPEVKVRALVRTADGTSVAGTATGGVWRSDDNGESWASLRAGLGLQDVQAISVTANGLWAGGTPADTRVDTRWSPFHLQDNEIHLDAVYSDLAPGGWALLRQEAPSAHTRLYRIANVAMAESRDLARPGPFTSLRVEAGAGLDNFDRETATLLAESVPLLLYDDAPVYGTQITLNRLIPGLERGHLLIISGRPMRARLAGQHEEQVRLTSADGLRQVELQIQESFQMLAPPTGLRACGDETSGVHDWHLRNRDGFEGTVPPGMATFVLEPALEEDRVVVETAVVRTVRRDPDHTAIELEQPLRYIFDRPSVAIYGNVVHATHGRTVRDEVLGSGDGSQANQRLRLRQEPLTFLSAPTPSGAEATLAVQVNGVTWHRVPFLQGLDRDSRAYILRQDARGNTNIIFGNGEQGARLPSGHEQITATYRVGLGPNGNMPAGSLDQLQTAPTGIESVTNPLPATGGVGPETLERARQNAPLTVRGVWRIVSLADYEDFVRRFAGIGKAQARLLHVGPRDVLHITLADGEGQPIPKTSNLYRMLVKAIDENRGAPEPRVYVDSYEPVYFDLQARLLIDPDHRERQRDVEAAVGSRIRRSFTFGTREFGQDVSASELISLMQDTPGIVAVQLIYLHRSTEGASLAAVLEASLARWHEGRPRPAQMLLVNAQGGVTLNLEVGG